MTTNFLEKKYCVVKNAISSELVNFITQYALFDELRNFSPEYRDRKEAAQVSDAHSKYADPAVETLLISMQDIIERSTNLKLYPTYSYYRVYRPGDELKIHKDRPACEISATICINYNYDDNTFTWPIFIDGDEINLSPGDMAIYKGCELSHWREEFFHSEDVWHIQAFLHFVDADGIYSSEKFDNRESAGLSSCTKFWKTDNYITYNSNMNLSKPYIFYK